MAPRRSQDPPLAGGSLEARALQGDDAAWDALITAHNRRVVLSLLAAGVRIGRARELAQEAWLRLLLKQRAGELTALSLPGLAISQARWLARDAHRTQQRHLRLLGAPVDATALPLACGAADPEQRTLDAQQLQRALRALERCPPRQREVFLAVYQSTQCHEDIADALGLSVQRLRQILWEVRRRVRAELSEGSKEHR